MDNPVRVEIDLRDLKRIRDALRICGEDLEAHVDEEYPESLRETYPSYQRKWENDIECARQAQGWADQLDANFVFGDD